MLSRCHLLLFRVLIKTGRFYIQCDLGTKIVSARKQINYYVPQYHMPKTQCFQQSLRAAQGSDNKNQQWNTWASQTHLQKFMEKRLCRLALDKSLTRWHAAHHFYRKEQGHQPLVCIIELQFSGCSHEITGVVQQHALVTQAR